jgi:hypothetical protein
VEPDEVEKRVMMRMIFPETMEALAEETRLPLNVLGDIIRQLLHHKFIVPVDAEGRINAFYDVDELRAFRYRLTGKGFEALGITS